MIACGCDPGGSENNYCDVNSGICSCLPNVVGEKCVECDSGYYNHPNCQGNSSHKWANGNKNTSQLGLELGMNIKYINIFYFFKILL